MTDLPVQDGPVQDVPEFGREVQLVRLPLGMPQLSDFQVVDSKIGTPGDGDILVRNTWMSVDPATRIRMSGSGYAAPLAVNKTLDGLAVGRVVVSRAPGYRVGDYVLHSLGWREFSVVPTQVPGLPYPRRIEVSATRPDNLYLGVLGPVGLTAWAGLKKVLSPRAGDVVYVSGAAGAVGSLAVQIAKLHGNTVIGSAGSAAKVAYVKDELGAEQAFSRRDGDIAELLHKAAPEGIDYYFDNVGGDHLEAAFEALRPGGQVVLCGAVSTYNAEAPQPGPKNLFNAISRGLTIRGFLVGSYMDELGEFHREMGQWVEDGRIRCAETVRDGIDSAPGAFIDLLGGENTGKMLVRL